MDYKLDHSFIMQLKKPQYEGNKFLPPLFTIDKTIKEIYRAWQIWFIILLSMVQSLLNSIVHLKSS